MPYVKDVDGALVEAPIHHWFGLTYASYLVLPRSVLQAMPPEWQGRLVALLDEASELVELPNDNYTVTLRQCGKFVRDPFANYRHPPAIPWRQAEGDTDGR